ncbi:hypothetical protein HK100_008498, partial [Physocladia obscura]
RVGRWLDAKEKAAEDLVPAYNNDVDDMFDIGCNANISRYGPLRMRSMQRRSKKKPGFDFGDMVAVAANFHSTPDSVGGVKNSQNQLTSEKRHNSFPPPGIVSEGLHNVLLEKSNLSNISKSKNEYNDETSSTDDFSEDENQIEIKQDFLLLANDSHKDFDEVALAGNPIDLMQRINSLKTREKVKEVLDEVEDYILKSQNTKKVASLPKKDVDQLLNMSMNSIRDTELAARGTPSPTTPKFDKSRANSVFHSRSRKNSVFQNFLSQSNLTKITAATTEDVDAVYYPWTKEGNDAQDLNNLLDFADELQQSKQPLALKQVSRYDIDTVFLVGSQDNIDFHEPKAKSISIGKFSYVPLNKAVNEQAGFENQKNDEATGIKDSVPNSRNNIHSNITPLVSKTVNFMLPESRHGISTTRSESSISAMISLNNNAIKRRDIDFFFDMADSHAKMSRKSKGVDIAGDSTRDFSEIFDLADIVLEQEINGKKYVKRGKGKDSSRFKLFRAVSDQSVFLEHSGIAFELSKNASFVREVVVPNGDVDQF